VYQSDKLIFHYKTISPIIFKVKASAYHFFENVVIRQDCLRFLTFADVWRFAYTTCTWSDYFQSVTRNAVPRIFCLFDDSKSQ